MTRGRKLADLEDFAVTRDGKAVQVDRLQLLGRDLHRRRQHASTPRSRPAVTPTWSRATCPRERSRRCAERRVPVAVAGRRPDRLQEARGRPARVALSRARPGHGRETPLPETALGRRPGRVARRLARPVPRRGGRLGVPGGGRPPAAVSAAADSPALDRSTLAVRRVRYSRYELFRVMRVGIVGMGYVGLPLAIAFCEAGTPWWAWTDARRSRGSRRPEPRRGRLRRDVARRDPRPAARDPELRGAARCDAVIICVPTPLTRNREPDLGPLIAAAEGVAPYCARPARRARVHDLPGHHARALVQPLLEESAWPPASTSTSPSRPSASTRAAPTTR